MNYELEETLWDEVEQQMERLGTYDIVDDLKQMGYHDIAMMVEEQRLRAAYNEIEEVTGDDELEWEHWELLVAIGDELLSHVREIESIVRVEVD